MFSNSRETFDRYCILMNSLKTTDSTARAWRQQLEQLCILDLNSSRVSIESQVVHCPGWNILDLVFRSKTLQAGSKSSRGSLAFEC